MTTQGIVIRAFGRSDVGQKRAKDEDAFLIADLTDSSSSPPTAATSPVELQVGERGVLLAVSDGMGGAQAGEVASSLALGAVHHGMSTVHASDAGVALRVSIEQANQHVFDTATATGRTGMGATLTAVLFHGAYAYVAEVGDSRAYLLRGGRMVQLTHDQSYVQQLLDAGALTPEESETSQFKNVILQAMGLGPTIAVVLNRISIRRHDRILVCSDGLSGTLESQDLLNIIVGSATLASACERLVATAVERGSEDDITVILAEVDGEGALALTEPERLSVETAKTLNLV